MDSEFCKMEFLTDQEGKELLLKDGKFQVMMEWEKPYMEACIDALQPSGDVLEVGFGCGYSATRIQSYRPKSHTIIEYHPLIAARARKWAESYPNVIIVEKKWQEALSHLGKYDTLFFDDYPLENEGELKQKKEMASLAPHFIDQAKKALDQVETKLSTFTFSREDLLSFIKNLEEEKMADSQFILNFFSDLKKRGNITKDLYEEGLRLLLEKKLITSKDLEKQGTPLEEPPPSSPFHFEVRGDRLFEFLEECLERHMNPNALFGAFIGDSDSKYEDEKFINKIIANPFLEYKEKIIPIKVPSHCTYYQGDKALVITIKKIGE